MIQHFFRLLVPTAGSFRKLLIAAGLLVLLTLVIFLDRDHRKLVNLRGELRRHRHAAENLSTIRLSLVAYHNDEGAYPFTQSGRGIPEIILPELSNWHIFAAEEGRNLKDLASDPFLDGQPIRYVTNGEAYVFGSAGPNGRWDSTEAIERMLQHPEPDAKRSHSDLIYDPTNGIHSRGDILVFSPQLGGPEDDTNPIPIWTRILHAPDVEISVFFGDSWLRGDSGPKL